MNTKDLTNFTTYLISTQDNFTLKDFDFLAYMDFDAVNPRNTLELAWLASTYVDEIPGNKNYVLTSLQDSILFLFSKIKWFQKHNFDDLNVYLNFTYSFFKANSSTIYQTSRYLLLKLAGDFVVIDMQKHDWAIASDEDMYYEYPENLQKVIFGITEGKFE